MKSILLLWCAWSWFSAIAGLWKGRHAVGNVRDAAVGSPGWVAEIFLTASLLLTILLAPALEVVRIFLIFSCRKGR